MNDYEKAASIHFPRRFIYTLRDKAKRGYEIISGSKLEKLRREANIDPTIPTSSIRSKHFRPHAEKIIGKQYAEQAKAVNQPLIDQQMRQFEQLKRKRSQLLGKPATTVEAQEALIYDLAKIDTEIAKIQDKTDILQSKIDNVLSQNRVQFEVGVGRKINDPGLADAFKKHTEKREEALATGGKILVGVGLGGLSTAAYIKGQTINQEKADFHKAVGKLDLPTE